MRYSTNLSVRGFKEKIKQALFAMRKIGIHAFQIFSVKQEKIFDRVPNICIPKVEKVCHGTVCLAVLHDLGRQLEETQIFVRRKFASVMVQLWTYY